MKAATKSLRNVQFVIRPSSMLLKIVVVVLIVFSTAALISMSWVRQSILVKTENMRQEALVLEHENDELEQKISILGSVQSVQQIAQEELGLVDPNTVLITPNN